MTQVLITILTTVALFLGWVLFLAIGALGLATIIWDRDR